MSYADRWREHARRKRVFLAVLLGGWLLAGAAGAALGLGFAGLAWVGLAWAAAALGAGLRLALWPCPRCGKPFFFGFPALGNPLARECIHCGLRFGAGADPAGVPEWAQRDGDDGRGGGP